MADLPWRTFGHDLQCPLSDGTTQTMLYGCWSISDDVMR